MLLVGNWLSKKHLITYLFQQTRAVDYSAAHFLIGGGYDKEKAKKKISDAGVQDPELKALAISKAFIEEFQK